MVKSTKLDRMNDVKYADDKRFNSDANKLKFKKNCLIPYNRSK